MKFWPFGKDSGKSKESDTENGISRGEEDGLVIVSNVGEYDIELYEHKSFSESAVGDTAFLDAMIPAAGAAVDAVNQFSHAIIRFPEGAMWADLINRKTPGWEGFKQLEILKDGKFQPQAAIKQAKLQPAAIGNLALQGAAMVVGQMCMVEINKQLEEVTSGIAAIQEEMRLERESNIEACMEMLKEYSEGYLTISDDPVEHQAVRNQIEAIRREAKEAWLFQMKHLQSLEKALRKSGKLKDGQLKIRMREFVQRDKAAHDAFVFLMAAEQVKMQYSQNFTASQIEREREAICGCLGKFTTLREEIQGHLISKIDKLQGKPLAIPIADNAQGAPANPVERFGQIIGNNAPRIFVPNMIEEAKRQRAEKKANYEDYVRRDNSIVDVANTRLDNLDDLSFIYNQANALLINESGIHYLCEKIGLTSRKRIRGIDRASCNSCANSDDGV